ncbi:CD276 antigen-like isoform 1-T1 [Fundulus diaphanus]
MSGNSVSVVWMVVSMLWTTPHVKSDTEIFCVFKKSCILPCSFEGGSDVIIHWFQLVAGSPRVHSYYNNGDQLGLQDQNFRGRTSMFKDLISSGNASLRLTGVKVEDQSRYKCHCSIIKGDKESFINLHVDAPVSKVRISKEGNMITCRSEGIYPEPQLTWSTDPPSRTALQNRTTVQQTEEQLYSISSSLMGLEVVSGMIYSCMVSTHSNKRRASLRQLSVISSSGQASLSCSGSDVSITNLLWTFNYSQTIVNQSSQSRVMVSEEWRHLVKDISESGSLSLQGLSPQQEGVYTCELNNEEETILTSTFLSMVEDQGGTKRNPGVLIFVGVTAAIVSVVLFICAKRNKALQDNGYVEARQ